MKIKLLLRFYFFADGAEIAIDNRILKLACSPCADAFEAAESICGLISEKSELSRLWRYLDGVIGSMPADDVERLEFYAGKRDGLTEEEKKGVKRAVMKFVRRARGAERFGGGIKLAGKYACLLNRS